MADSTSSDFYSDFDNDIEDARFKFAQLRLTNENNGEDESLFASQYRSQPRVSEIMCKTYDVIAPRKEVTRNANNGNDDDNETYTRSCNINRSIANSAMTQHGSQFLQNVLSKDNKFKDLIFEGVYDYLFDVMVHEFANYVFGKLIEICNENQLQLIVIKLTNDRTLFGKVVSDRYGSNSVKRLIKVLEKSSMISGITSLLASDFTKFMKNRNSSFVIIQCFKSLDAKQNKQLFEETIKHCIELAIDEKACVVLNESLEYFKQPHRDNLLQAISSEARFLSQDAFGNYVVQQVIELHHPYFNNEILNLLNGDFVRLSMLKSSSRVVEKCLLTEKGLIMVLEEFISSDKLWKVARDQNGNYVIQKALIKAKGTLYYEALVEKLNNEKHLFQFGFGKNIYNKLVNL